MHERAANRGKGIQLTRRKFVWIRRGGGSSAMAIPLGDVSGGNKTSDTIDR